MRFLNSLNNGQKVKLGPARSLAPWRLSAPLHKGQFFLLTFQAFSFFTRPCSLPACTCHVDWHIFIILRLCVYLLSISDIFINTLKDKCSSWWVEDFDNMWFKKNLDVGEPLFLKLQECSKCGGYILGYSLFKLNKK